MGSTDNLFLSFIYLRRWEIIAACLPSYKGGWADNQVQILQARKMPICNGLDVFISM